MHLLRSFPTRFTVSRLLGALLLLAPACGTAQTDPPGNASGGAQPNSGGTAQAAGGSATSGGANPTTGGASPTTGGARATTGGSPTTTGGVSATTGGSSSATGGATVASGGVSNAGSPSGGTGGGQPTGGAGASGGSAKGSGGGGSSNGGTASGGSSGGAAAGAGGSGGKALVPSVNVTVDATHHYQTFEGWGTSLCWFGNVVGGFSDMNRNAVADRLFDAKSGLGLNVVRYNIGGGDAPDHTHMGYGKKMPGFKPTEAGGYVWTADDKQLWMLNAARSRIPAAEFIAEAFSNSPPYWMTVSGCASGSTDGSNNLKSDYYDDFANYLSEVVLHFKTANGVEFRTLEALNEPNANWWKAQGAQEGCHFDRANQAQLLGLLRTSLDARGLTAVRLSAADESSFDEAVDTYNAYSEAVQTLVVQLNTHAYSGSKRKELLGLATRDAKRLWASEVDGSGAPAPFDVYAHNHDDIVPGLDLANRITRDLKELQPHAWVFWQAVENETAQVSLNKNWGLLHGDFQGTSQSHMVTKKYHAFGQYTRQIRPGYQMIDVNQADAVAFVGPATLVIVQRNAGTSDAVYGYDLSSFTTLGARAEVVRTSASENYVSLSPIALNQKKLIAPITRQSITTFVIAGTTP